MILLAKIRRCLAVSRRTVLLAALLIFSGLPAAHAVEVAGLYDVNLPVASQQVSDRTKAARRGLEQVIQRISGSSEALLNPNVQAALQNPQRYLQEFSYFVDDEAPRQDAQRLRLRFDSALVNGLLREAKQPIWGSNRPNLAVWLAEEHAGNRAIVSADDQSRWQQAMRQAAEDVGLPLLLPLMDLQDESSISVMDVWGLFRDRLEAASQRYRAEAVLGGRVYQSAGQWQGRWLLIFGDQPVSFSTSGAERQSVVNGAFDRVAKIFASHYAIDTSRQTDSQLKMSVEGVDSLADYASLISYLEGFAVVRHVTVTRVEGERLTLVLTTESDWQTLKELIALDRYLQPLPDAVTEFEDGLMLMPYIWRP